ncbi:F-box protein At3g07870-like [Papaver somniferum]|uniref:F-box protein At3g07870-like n=1 Tax=Papaver somniferum TaxID=3469 RepID=UPI000E6FCF4F|nr:F-box protein At3g07870-like [Papaver somniferum]
MEYLSSEIIIDILSRLPVETVLICKLVCQEWLVLLRCTYFSNMHSRLHLLQLDHVNNKYLCDSKDSVKFELGFHILLAITHVDKKDKKRKVELYYGDYVDGNICCSKFKRLNHPPCTALYSSVIGSCHGLVCMTGERQDPVHIFNPLTGEQVDLPIFEKDNDPSRIMKAGFGYVPSKNEYKVVRVFYPANLMAMGQVQVYTLGDGNGWRDQGEINYELFPSSGVFADGAIHWIHLERQKIVSFDLEDEVFRYLPLPPLLSCANYHTRLVVLRGCVSLVQGSIPPTYEIEVWSLRQKFWVWEFKLVPTAYGYDPFAVTKNGEVLLSHYKKILSIYNPNIKALNILLRRDNINVNSSRVQAVLHMNSFVSLKAIGEKETKTRRQLR